ncbi:MAG: DUF1553 domain-containing protein, partial [Planctomycetaceae bacterium]|nr:DUF1553 domain-containing protein [Planctomycetaceae bacterium]
LSPKQINLLKSWIDTGANWPETEYDREAAIDKRLSHWAFQPIVPGEPPASDDPRFTAVDRFLVSRLNEAGLEYSPRADRRTLIRRASIVLTGLLPAPEQVEEFCNDRSVDAWPRLIERLLASPRYGERWAQHWLDIVRYADTHGFEVNTPRENAWPYRDYVIQSFNADLPYDQFVREQIAGDVYGADAATGFLVASAVLLPGQIGADEESKRAARQDALDEMIVGTGGTFLGLTIGCARCHDHKFDPISAKDYYSMQAFFAGVDYGDRPIRDAETEHRRQQANDLAVKIKELQDRLLQYEPFALNVRTLVIDEQDPQFTTILQPANGPGTNPGGVQRGYRDDGGSKELVGNISGGQYTWWNNQPGKDGQPGADIMTYNPGAAGVFDLWISWGAHGSGVHTRDARYILDLDGDLQTLDDQREVARIDQYYLAGISEGDSEKKPLWSGLYPVGRLELQPRSRLILRSGQTGSGITADVIVLQEVSPDMAGSLQTAQPILRPPLNFAANSERFAPVEARFVRFSIQNTHNNDQYEPCLDELEVFASTDSPDLPGQNIALAALGTEPTSSGNLSETGRHQLRHINDGLYGNEHSWISNERGRGWVQLEFPRPYLIDRLSWGRDRTGRFRDRLPVRYSIDVSLDGQEWNTVATNSDRAVMDAPFDLVQAMLRSKWLTSSDATATADGSVTDLNALSEELRQLSEQKSSLETPRMVYAGVFHEPEKTFLLRRGDAEQRLEETTPAIPAVFVSHPDAKATGIDVLIDRQTHSSHSLAKPQVEEFTADQQRRFALANWIGSGRNVLTARVMVNRIWQYHFGQGIVGTPSDFGLNGERPTHPELLDWLASEFIRSGWSVKHMHRLLLMSTAWQQSSHIEPEAAAIDRGNRLLWRFTSRRIEAEAIRDGMLQITGELNLQTGGPGFNFFKTRGGLNGFPPVEKFTPDHMRRMIYAHKIRMEKVPVFGSFDCPDAGQAMPRRSLSTTAIQALNLFNSPFVYDRSTKLAERIEGEVGSDTRQQIDRAYLLTLSRLPGESEFQRISPVVQEHGLKTLCRVLLNSNEFLFLP